MSAREGWTPISIARAEDKPRPISDEVVVGKDVLELLTGAMYSDPLMVYREYIQNAADSVEDLLSGPHGSDDHPPHIEVHLNAQSRTVRIRDTGAGIPQDQFVSRLTALGASQKRGQQKRGFRGVGRLSGLGYCRTLVFRSRRSRTEPVLELVWDGRRLRELLRDASYKDDLKSLVKSITTIRAIPAADYPSRFFEVEMQGIARVKNDALLNAELIASYLAEVAPVDFDSTFSGKKQLDALLKTHGIRTPAAISVVASNTRLDVVRPIKDNIPINKQTSHVGEIECFSIPGLEEDVAAIGWIAHHDYLGSIPRWIGVEGLRIRCGNIQIGGSRLLDELFQEPRFNSWCIGEVHVLTPKIVPNGRRDNFEANAAWQDLQGKLASIALLLSKRCRARSIARNRMHGMQRDYQATIDLVDLIAFRSRFGMGAKDADAVVGRTLAMLDRSATSSQLADDARERAADLARDLRARVKHKGRARKDPLSFLSPVKRAAYQEVFTHMLKASRKPGDCIKMIDTIVASAKRRARSGTV